MCYICDLNQAEHDALAEAESCFRIVCRCGNLLHKQALTRGETASTIHTVGECCATGYGIALFTRSPHVTKDTSPGSLDERTKRRKDSLPEVSTRDTTG